MECKISVSIGCLYKFVKRTLVASYLFLITTLPILFLLRDASSKWVRQSVSRHVSLLASLSLTILIYSIEIKNVGGSGKKTDVNKFNDVTAAGVVKYSST